MLGLMTGYPDGSFKPDQQISRAEMAAIIARITNASDSVTDGSFMDISGHWAQGAIVEAQSAGIMSGYSDGTFRPDQPLTRAEAVVTINRLLDRGPLSGAPSKWSDVSEQHWAYAHIQEASISHNFEALIGGGEKYAAAP
ncbi:hypothetical protein GOM71_12305 [Paenibacillus sp. NEAU-GSW1]|nr:hypothetical protein [Paenibacillus sp. NEAU-GSW1]